MIVETGAGLLPYALALATTGLVAGIIAGLLGVGGGIVIVPVLFHVFTALDIDLSIRMHLAVGTSLATIIPTSIMSARAHYRRGSVDIDLMKSWGPAVLVGVATGTILAGPLSGRILTAIFATVAILVAVNMAFNRAGAKVSDHLPQGPAKWGIGAVIGTFSALMGIGGGTLSVPILSAFNYPIRRAVGTAAAIGLIISIPGTIGFTLNGLGESLLPPFSLGYVSLIGFACIVPCSMLTAPVGARIAHTIDMLMLRRAFALFLGLTSLRMYWSLLG